jgi:hypothetical protein
MKLRRGDRQGYPVDKRDDVSHSTGDLSRHKVYRYQLNRYGKESNAQTLDLDTNMADSVARVQDDRRPS